MVKNIINSLIERIADLEELVKFYNEKIKVSKAEFKMTLEGHITKHQRFMLRLHKDSIADKERLIEHKTQK